MSHDWTLIASWSIMRQGDQVFYFKYQCSNCGYTAIDGPDGDERDNAPDCNSNESESEITTDEESSDHKCDCDDNCDINSCCCRCHDTDDNLNYHLDNSTE
jgi:hypothetical protein